MQINSLPDKSSSTGGSKDSDSSINKEVKSAVLAGLGYFATGPTLEVLVYLLEVEHSVEFNSIAENPGLLRKGLSAMFGSAVEVVEAKICQALGRRFQISIDDKSLDDLISIIRSQELAR
jgi:hypothetical protein